MSELIARLHEAGNTHKGSDLGGLLQWAMLHIAAQEKRIQQLEAEIGKNQN